MKKIIRPGAILGIALVLQLTSAAQLPVLVKDINTTIPTSGVTGISPQLLTDVNGRLFFYGTHPQHGVEVYVSDGTAAGTHMVVDINEINPLNIINVNGTCFIYRGSMLYKTDGTPSGTMVIKKSLLYFNYPIVSGSNFYFSGRAGSYDNEIWKSDGTEAGTVMIKDIHATGA